MDSVVTAKLIAKNIYKGYGEKAVLKDISFTVEDGEFLSILGASGCGKTTLLRILIGLIEADKGVILKNGEDITRKKPSERGMGIVFQNYALFENMTVEKNVEYALLVNKATKGIARETAEKMLEMVGLTDQAKKYPKDLSGGQQQRVAIARTLALRPDIVLFDEPMSALDAATRLAMRAELKNLQKELGMTMIYVTHDQEEAFAMSDRIMIMHEGVICQLDTPESICDNPADEYVRSFVVDNLNEKISSISKFVR